MLQYVHLGVHILTSVTLNITKELGAVQEQQSRQKASSADKAKETYSQLQPDVDVDRVKDRAEYQYSTTYHPGPRPNGNIHGHVTSPPTISESSFPPDPMVEERNREYLVSLDVHKVLN